jgi:hypothetical protein
MITTITNSKPFAKATKTSAQLSDPGISYNEAGITYNQAGLTYGGLYGEQDVIMTIQRVVNEKPIVNLVISQL